MLRLRLLEAWVADEAASPLTGNYSATHDAVAAAQEAGLSATPSFAEAIDLGYTRTLSVVIARSLARRLRRQSQGMRLAAVVVVASWPILVNELLVIATHWSIVIRTSHGQFFLVGFAVVDSGILVAAWLGWRLLLWSAIEVDQMLPRDDDRQELAEWATRRTRVRPQLIFASTAAILGAIFLYFARHALHGRLEITAWSYVVVAWTCFIGANDAYWLYTVAELPYRLGLRCRDLQLRRLDPANTPGIVALCDTYLFVAFAVFAGVVAIEAVALAIPYKSHAPLLETAAFGFPIIALITGLLVGAQPIMMIEWIVKRKRREALTELHAERESGLSLPQHGGRSVQDDYVELRDSRTLPINTAGVPQYIAALIALFGVYMVNYVVRHFF